MRQHLKLITIGVAVVLAMLVALVAALPGPDDEPPIDTASEGPLDPPRTRRALAGLTSLPEDLDPHAATSDAQLVVLDQVYDTLVRPDEQLRPQPALATAWEVSDDDLTWTFELREGVTFHDGSPLTARDVIASIDRILDDGAGAHHLAPVDDLDTPREGAVEVQLQRPTPDLPARLGASPQLAIVPAEAITADQLDTEVVGTGPFRLDPEREDDEEALALDRFDDHWGPRPLLEGVTFSATSDGLERLRAGDLDWVGHVPADELAAVEDDPELHLARRAGIEYWQLAFNLDRAPFDESAWRHAVGFALDRETLAEAGRHVAASPNQTAAPAGSWWHHELAPFAHDPEEAAEILETTDASSRDLELLVTSEQPEAVATAEAVGEQLAGIGIEVEVREEGLDEFLTAQAEGDFDAFVLGWRGALDPDQLYYPPHHSEGARNYHGYADEEVDELLEDARRETDPEVRRALYGDAVGRIVDAAGYLYLHNSDVVRAWSADLRGVELRPDRALPFTGAELDRSPDA